MQELTPEGLAIVDDLARRHAVSRDAVQTLLHALVVGNGTQAQFTHPDLGGMGQWSQGGMIMVGDMFNQGLKYRVDTLCRELANFLRAQPLLSPSEASQSQSQGQGGGHAGVSLFVPGAAKSFGNWWPSELGNAGSTGAQNNLHYACFPAARRLAIRHGDRVSVYDTGEHRIMGFSQQQGGDQSLTFTSQFGLVRVADLPLVAPTRDKSHDPSVSSSPEPELARSEPPAGTVKTPVPASTAPAAASTASGPASTAPEAASTDDILTMIERISNLRQKNILTEEEFAAKKTELLNRL
jgi:hypothetical protein